LHVNIYLHSVIEISLYLLMDKSFEQAVY